MSWALRRKLVGWACMAPYLAFFLVFIVVPIIVSAWLALVQLDLANVGASRFVGLQNFQDAFADQFFWMAAGATLQYVVLFVPSVIVVGMVLGLGMHAMRRGREAVRALVYLPSMLNVAAAGILWQWFFNNEFGLFNSLLKRAGLPAVPWLTEAALAMPSICLMSLWWTVGGTAVLVLAGLQQIPRMYFEAAALDGATSTGVFRLITLPLLKPVLLFIFVTTTIASFQMFGQAMILTGGGPAFATRGMVQFMYETAFNGFRFGYGASISWLLFAGILAFSLIQARVLRSQMEA